MLILTGYPQGEPIVIHKDGEVIATVMVCEIYREGKGVKLGFEAPADVRIDRTKVAVQRVKL